MIKRVLAILAYMLPTFPLGYFWHLVFFADYYKKLEVYRDELIIPLGILSMFIQGVVWSFVYEKMFGGEKILTGAMKFFLVACPIAISYQATAVAAKHRMTSASDYLLIEIAFIVVHYVIVSPLIAAVYAGKVRK